MTLRNARSQHGNPAIHTVGVRLTAGELRALDAEVTRQSRRVPGANVSRSSYLRGFVAKLTRRTENDTAPPHAA